MNAPILTPLAPPRPLLASDVMFLVESGLIDPTAHFELLDGAIIPMSPKGRLHEAMRERLTDWLREPWSAPFRLLVEHTLIVDAETMLEPDFVLYDRARSIADAPLLGSDVHLVIEVANSSWKYDTGEKAMKFARFGLREYWVIDAAKHTARVHRVPANGAWTQAFDIGAGEAMAPLCAPTARFNP